MDRSPARSPGGASRREPLESPVAPAALRFVGLGDSLTQGVGDPRPGRAGFSGTLDGWVAHFASAVRASGQPIEVRNLAFAGARLAHVIDDQLGKALREPADVISCFIGINDLWDANLDLNEFGARFERLSRQLASRSPIVITASIHDVFAPFPLRAHVREKVNRNVAAMNDIIRQAVTDHGLVLIDVAGRPDMVTSSVKAVDFLHPNRYGHQLIAAEVVRQLHERGHLLDVEPTVAVQVRRGAQDLAHVAWVGGYVRRNWKRWREEMASSEAGL